MRRLDESGCVLDSQPTSAKEWVQCTHTLMPQPENIFEVFILTQAKSPDLYKQINNMRIKHIRDWQPYAAQYVSGYTIFICQICKSEYQKCLIHERGYVYHRYISFRNYDTTLVFFDGTREKF